ncbi:hypothetical protein [Lewinella sp. 4G2]|uniref:hypothetical protein n=1 Tax=Lewinella sp. 4G2 TaxID=1803372 RepID=UPI0007B4E454|nr:hypothetical protein [Lewinella sp. 4G2]OAV43973.1 hypothetical protein A3850_005460 [Lewinella sp. 4G2]
MYRLLFLLAATTLLAFSCTPKASVAGGMANAKTTEMGKETTLKPGETIMVEGYTGSLTFVEVQTDSRCPEGVDCIQAGEAEVVVELPGGIKQVAKVAADYKTAKRIISGDIVVNILGLTPYPKEGKRIDAGDYKLLVSTNAL